VKPIPLSAFQEVSGFEAKKHNMRQTNDGLWQLTLTVAEFGNADWLIHAQPGTPLAIGLQALDYDNPEQPKESPNKRYIQRAALLCKEESFQKFMEVKAAVEGFYGWGLGNMEIEAACALRAYLQIQSRSDLGHQDNELARAKMDMLVKEWKS